MQGQPAGPCELLQHASVGCAPSAPRQSTPDGWARLMTAPSQPKRPGTLWRGQARQCQQRIDMPHRQRERRISGRLRRLPGLRGAHLQASSPRRFRGTDMILVPRAADCGRAGPHRRRGLAEWHGHARYVDGSHRGVSYCWDACFLDTCW